MRGSPSSATSSVTMASSRVDEAERILEAAAARGLGLRIHADQLATIGATPLAIRLGAISADHLEQLDGPDLEALARSGTVATLLPGPALVMRDRLPPARMLLDAGATVALASDANAGTFGTWGAMPLVIGLGCTVLGMTAAGGGPSGNVWRRRVPGPARIGGDRARRGCRPGGVGRRPRGCLRAEARIGRAASRTGGRAGGGLQLTPVTRHVGCRYRTAWTTGTRCSSSTTT